MWFMNDWVSEHLSHIVRDTLAGSYHEKWIFSGGPVSWLQHSLNLSPLYFYMWVNLKQLFYAEDTNNADTFIQGFQYACKPIRHCIGVHGKVCHTMIPRVHACAEASVGQFENLLQIDVLTHNDGQLEIY